MNFKKPARKQSPSSDRGGKGSGRTGSSFKKPSRNRNSESEGDEKQKPFRSGSGEGRPPRKPFGAKREDRGNSRGPEDRENRRESKRPSRSGEDRPARKPFDNKREDRGNSRGQEDRENRRESKRPFRSGEDKPPRKPFGNRKEGERSEGRRPPERDGNSKPYRDRDDRERKPYSSRDSKPGSRKPFSREGDREERKPFRSDGSRGGRRGPSSDGERGERRPYSGNSERGSFSRDNDRRERRPFREDGDRGQRRERSGEGERKPFSRDSQRGDRKPFSKDGGRGKKPFSSSEFQKGKPGSFSREEDSYSQRPQRGQRGGFQGKGPSRGEDRFGYEEDSHREGIRAGWQSAKLSLSEFDRPEALTYHASCGDGLAFLLKEEVEEAGLELLSENRGGVFFRGPARKVRDFCLSSGIASGISFELSSWNDIQGPDDLYEVAAMYPFEKLLSPGTKFRIDATTKDSLPDSRYATYRLKDAIFDRFRAKGLELPEADREEPEVLFYIRSRMDQVKLFLALHPQPLQRRGHEREGGEAPLRETLAQALLRFSGWKPGEAMYDPFCGSGTLLIEAALRMRNGGWINYKSLSRSTIFTRLFGPSKAKDVDTKSEILLYGSDVSEEAIQLAKKNAKEAGVADLIRFETFSAENPPEGFPFRNGKIVTNPPYGIRIGDKESVSELYSIWGETLKSRFQDTYVSLVSGDPSLLGYLKLKADKEQSVTIAKLKGKLVAYRIN